jgi:uncharacterized membrane protein
MNTYDVLVNDYLRAVEQALAGVPANRRAELLADLSEHISAKRAELGPEETEVEVRSILELLGDPDEVAADAAATDAADAAYDAKPMVIEPKRKSAAVIWVLITIAAVASLCVLAGLAVGIWLFAAGASSGSGGSDPARPAIVPVSSPT